jgi:hypothetical protein
VYGALSALRKIKELNKISWWNTKILIGHCTVLAIHETA